MTNWVHTDKELRRILKKNDDPDNESESVSHTKAELIPYLKGAPHFGLLSPSIIEEMEKSSTFHSFNQSLNRIWDYADEHKIWIA